MTKRPRYKPGRRSYPESSAGKVPLPEAGHEIDPLTGYTATMRVIQGFQTTKTYMCPECNDFISIGTRHFVIVPVDAPDLRRHWHTYCWSMRKNREPKSGKARKPR